MSLKNILILLAVFLALGGYFFYARTPPPAPKAEPKLFAWLIELEEIEHIKIELPREGKSQSFIKIEEGDKFPWYFDDPDRSAIDTKRWGGGIPLLLSGPGVERVIAKDTTEEKRTELGLTQPLMVITLTLENGSVLNIKVGDKTPDGHAFYVQAPDSNDVGLVDYTWYDVLERLVREPPYAPPATD